MKTVTKTDYSMGDNMGHVFYSRYRDENGDPIERTPLTHPYSYQGFVLWGKNSQFINACVYSDRIYEWDYKKHNELCMRHFGNEGQYWENRDHQKIEDFLKDWTGKNVRLLMIMQHCNQATGYPCWSFHYIEQ
jgi:hypothetical protein